MNELIKELALEARIAYYSKNGAYEASDEGLSVIPSTQSLEKFAELIVQACSETVQDFVDHRFPASEYPDRLKKYFGVDYPEDEDDEVKTCPRCGDTWSGTSCGAQCGWIVGE